MEFANAQVEEVSFCFCHADRLVDCEVVSRLTGDAVSSDVRAYRAFRLAESALACQSDPSARTSTSYASAVRRREVLVWWAGGALVWVEEAGLAVRVAGVASAVDA